MIKSTLKKEEIIGMKVSIRGQMKWNAIILCRKSKKIKDFYKRCFA